MIGMLGFVEAATLAGSAALVGLVVLLIPSVLRRVLDWVRFPLTEPYDKPEAYRTFMSATRKEAGCIFFEMPPSPVDPDVVMVVECFRSEADHVFHSATPHMATFQDLFLERLVESHFEEIIADPSVSNGAMFAPIS